MLVKISDRYAIETDNILYVGPDRSGDNLIKVHFSDNKWVSFDLTIDEFIQIVNGEDRE